MRLEESIAGLAAHLTYVKARQAVIEEVLVEKGIISFDEIDERARQINDEVTREILISTTNLSIEELEEIRENSNKK